MVLLDIVTDLLTNLAAKWDNTNIADADGNDATFCRDYAKTQQTTTIYTNGVIALGDPEYDPTRQYKAYRGETYIVPITMIKYMRSRAGFIDTIQELDRCCNDYNDDGNNVLYFLRNVTIPSNDNILEISRADGAYLEVIVPLVGLST